VVNKHGCLQGFGLLFALAKLPRAHCELRIIELYNKQVEIEVPCGGLCGSCKINLNVVSSEMDPAVSNGTNLEYVSNTRNGHFNPRMLFFSVGSAMLATAR
jgi:hypothetical protein